MKKFKFTMQSILNVKISLKEARQAELAEANAQLMLQEEILAGINRKIRESMDPARLSGKSSASYYVQRERYVRRLKENRKRQNYIIEQAKIKVNNCIEALKEALVEQKKMEKARERQHNSWNIEFQRDEQKTVDETGGKLAFFRSIKAEA